MKRSIVLSVSLFMSLAAIASGQISRAPQGCPRLTAVGPDTAVAGAPFNMTASVAGGDRNVTPTYNWTISAGTISSGQGTSMITIDTTGAGGQSITGTVEVGGYDRACDTARSTTTFVTAPVLTRKFDEFGPMVGTEDQYARLDNFAIEIQNDPGSSATLLFYAGRKSRIGAIEALTDQTKNYLVDTRGIDASRLKVVNGGFRETGLIELWLVPSGGESPVASPTVDPSEANQLPALKKKPVKPVKKPIRKKT